MNRYLWRFISIYTGFTAYILDRARIRRQLR
nr:MAG TPA: hypothetical protein [Siphoviridae sp. ctEci12]